ncbi:hypothetical protein [Kutzneria sp. 744]
MTHERVRQLEAEAWGRLRTQGR